MTATERLTIDRLMIDQVRAGDEIPPLAVDVNATAIVLGALASRDWRPMHHDKQFAIERNGVRDIFMNTPNQAAWFERYLTDWTGPAGRPGRMKFRMKDSVFPGDRMTLRGVVEKVDTDDVGCGWLDVSVTLSVDEKPMTECAVRIAIPTREGDNPWQRRGDQWKP